MKSRSRSAYILLSGHWREISGTKGLVYSESSQSILKSNQKGVKRPLNGSNERFSYVQCRRTKFDREARHLETTRLWLGLDSRRVEVCFSQQHVQ